MILELLDVIFMERSHNRALISVIFSLIAVILLAHDFLVLSGITITGLEDPLMVGESATISCITNELASLIEWSNKSSGLTMDVNVTVLNYTISLVTDDLQGETFTCTAVVSNTNDTERVTLNVAGTALFSSVK